MPYIDLVYYKNDYKGVDLEVDTFDRLVVRASDTIDILTGHKLLGLNVDELAPVILRQIKKATAMQVEYLSQNDTAKELGSGGYGQVTAGSFSYGEKAGASQLSRAQQMTTQKVIETLIPTGLLYAGVDVYD